MTPYLLVLGAILRFFVMLKTPKAKHDACSCIGSHDDLCGSGRDTDGGGDAS